MHYRAVHQKVHRLDKVGCMSGLGYGFFEMKFPIITILYRQALQPRYSRNQPGLVPYARRRIELSVKKINQDCGGFHLSSWGPHVVLPGLEYTRARLH